MKCTPLVSPTIRHKDPQLFFPKTTFVCPLQTIQTTASGFKLLIQSREPADLKDVKVRQLHRYRSTHLPFT